MGKQAQLTVQQLLRSFHNHHIANNSWLPEPDGITKPPHMLAAERGGSNCAKDDISRICAFYYAEGVDMVSFTDHSRDGEGLSSEQTVAGLMFDAMLKHPEWLHFAGVSAVSSESDKAAVRRYADTAAHTLIQYGDERLTANWDRIEQMRVLWPGLDILSGLEVNLLTNGQVDTDLVYDPRCQIFVLSLHPDVDEDGFASSRQDPEEHLQRLVAAIKKHQPHIMAHIGFRCALAGQEGEAPFRRAMDLAKLAKTLTDYGTTLEVNWSPVWKEICRFLVNPDKNSATRKEWQAKATAVFEKTPFLSDPVAMAKLAPAIQDGLLIVLDNDGHEVPPLNAVPGRFEAIMDMYLDWVNQRLALYNISSDQLINSWPLSYILDWFSN